jgi:hypothetical protein
MPKVAYRTEDVAGIVIGAQTVTGALYYDGRKQGANLSALNEAELERVARQNRNELVTQFGDYPCYLYADSSKWELRIFEAGRGEGE